jgi:hypothetical protein
MCCWAAALPQSTVIINVSTHKSVNWEIFDMGIFLFCKSENACPKLEMPAATNHKLSDILSRFRALVKRPGRN